ncbi:unnamed protein product, partial [Mycena citricolor]
MQPRTSSLLPVASTWSPSAATLREDTEWVAPVVHHRSRLRRAATTTTSQPSPNQTQNHLPPVRFVCDVPENPLYAAIAHETVLEQPRSPDGMAHEVAHSALDFTHRRIESAARPHSSALTPMFASSSPCANPFPRPPKPPPTDSLPVSVYFPHTAQPSNQIMCLSVELTATVEDVISAALWTYCRKRWLPKLDPGKDQDVDVGSWIVLVPGKDGAVNKRIAKGVCVGLANKICKFRFAAYAIVRAPRDYADKKEIELQLARFRAVMPASDRRSPVPPFSRPPVTTQVMDHPLSYRKLPSAGDAADSAAIDQPDCAVH